MNYKKILFICFFISFAFLSFSFAQTQYHIHKNAPHRSFSNKIDAKGLITDYITYFYGDEIIMKHRVSFLANGQININGNCTTNFKVRTPDKGWNNTSKNGNQTIVTCYYYQGKIKAAFTISNNGNGNFQ